VLGWMWFLILVSIVTPTESLENQNHHHHHHSTLIDKSTVTTKKSSTTSTTTTSIIPSSSFSTRVTGYGSHDPTAPVTQQSTLSSPLWIHYSPMDGELWLRCSTSNPTSNQPVYRFSLRSLDADTTPNESPRTITRTIWNWKRHKDGNSQMKCPPDSEWIPMDGIYGVYQIPSGVVWVFVSSSSTVYQSVPWGEIRSVDSLHLIHVPHTPNKKRLSSRHRTEQRRQLRLLRYALKNHDLYFTVGGTVDITQTLQRAFVTPSPHLSSSLSNSVKWWNGSTTPDSRFFWNQFALQPLLVEYTRVNSNNSNKDDVDTLFFESILDHCIPISSAFVGIESNLTLVDKDQSTVPRISYDQLLIGRRSRFRAGTRFTKRGADGRGAVANYVETEQIGRVQKVEDTTTQKSCQDTTNSLQFVSHVQTRGSLPLRWSSPADVTTYRPRVRIGTDPVAQARALHRHLIAEWDRYVLMAEKAKTITSESSLYKKQSQPKLVLVNLVDKSKDQGRLGRVMDAVLQAVLDTQQQQQQGQDQDDIHHHAEAEPTMGAKRPLSSETVQHIWYDFHAEVKGGRWYRLEHLLRQLSPILAEHGYFKLVYNESATSGNTTNPIVPWTVERIQTGIIRTNCMDCLDRTNVVQSMIGRYALFQGLSNACRSYLGTSDIGSRFSKSLRDRWTSAFRSNALVLPWSDVGDETHRLLWADHADAISRLYAGTPALKRDFTRTGQRTTWGAVDDGVNSLQRYYWNNFRDADRQEGIDLMTGYADFTFMNNDEDLESKSRSPKPDRSSKNYNTNTIKNKSISLMDAARTALEDTSSSQWDGSGFMVDDPDSNDDDTSTFVRIKVPRPTVWEAPRSKIITTSSLSSYLTSSSVGQQQQSRQLELRWLPGDLQSLVKANSVLSSKTTNLDALLDLDRRTSHDHDPWWVIHDETNKKEDSYKVDDDDTRASMDMIVSDTDDYYDEDDENASIRIREKRWYSPISMGFIVGGMLAIFQAPIATATTVIVVLGWMMQGNTKDDNDTIMSLK
jgi:SacI homology domain